MTNFASSADTTSLDLSDAWMDFDAANISLGEPVKQTDPQEHFFASLINNMPTSNATLPTESPMLDTPFLDGCMSTPYTPASVFTPCLDMFQTQAVDMDSTPYMNQSFQLSSNDVQIASYLQDSTSTLDPVFNGNPSELMLDKSNTDASDALFPPLSSTEDHDVPSQALFGDGVPDFGVDPFDFLGLGFDMFLMPDSQLEAIPEPSEPTMKLTKKTKKNPSGKVVKRKRESKAVQQDDERRFECPLCYAKFTRRFNLGTHMKTHDKDRQKEHLCYICKKSFDRKHDCDRHISTVHRGERLFECGECPSNFSRKDALTRHLVQKHGYDDIA